MQRAILHRHNVAPRVRQRREFLFSRYLSKDVTRVRVSQMSFYGSIVSLC